MASTIKLNSTDTYVRDTYNKIAREYAEKYHDVSIDFPRVDEFIDLLPPKASVLDAGCGVGGFTAYIASKGFVVEGIDISEAMINEARKRHPRLNFKIMDMRQLDYPDQTFGGIEAAYSLIYIPSTEKISTFKELYRVLKQDGLLHLLVQEGMKDQLIDEPLSPGDKLFVSFFSEEELKTALIQSGFIIMKLDKYRPNYNDPLTQKVFSVIAKKEA